jgi:TctA family transporter
VTELMGGVSFIPALIGMFAISEVIRYTTTPPHAARRAPSEPMGPMLARVPHKLKEYRLNIVRGSGLGAMIGVLPGAGADMAAWISYGVSKRFSKKPEKYGDGHCEGLIDASSANNAGLSGAWVPALVFGVPGDSITAIAIGVLYMKGLNPGPTIFLENAELLNAVFIIFFVANLILLPLGLLAIRASTLLLKVPQRILMPVILIFCIVGSFAITNSVYGIAVMLAMGLIAYIMEENGFPIAPTVLGIVLGSMIEEMFLASMIKSDGNFLEFFSRPISAVLGAVTIIIWCIPIIRLMRNKNSHQDDVTPPGSLS